MDNNTLKIGIVGGGAAGLLAAAFAAQNGAQVTLFEKNDFVGKKLMITGKGRCNVTNNCSVSEFIENTPTNPRFMYTAINSFTPQDTMNLFESLGVKLKTERGNRVFPESDKSIDIVNALKKFAHNSGVKIIFERVTDVIESDGVAVGIKTDRKKYTFDKIIVCTGGKSYPRTGSTGDGYKFCNSLGLEVTPLYPSLVPFEISEPWCKSLQGLALKNIAIKIIDSENGKCVYSDFGELLFTHFGLSGPVILSASSHIRKITSGRYKIKIDLKPALDEKTLDARLLSDFSKNKNRDFINSLDKLMPQKLIPVFVNLSGIESDRKVNTITKTERKTVLDLLKSLELTIKGTRPIDEAIITSGGLSIKELNPKTMESKKIKNLYFAGEIIDVDAYTGGFNLQIAFSTAYVAAMSASQIY